MGNLDGRCALFPRILWIVDSTIRSRRFDKSTISLLIYGCSLQALESFGVGTYCVRRGKERGSERARERERGENGECFGSPVAVLLKDLMDEQRLTVANFFLGLGLGFAEICESGWKQYIAILFIFPYFGWLFFMISGHLLCSASAAPDYVLSVHVPFWIP